MDKTESTADARIAGNSGLVPLPNPVALGAILDDLYASFNAREWIHPDPLEFVYRYEDPRDREVVGLIAACLAYGRVAQILTSVSRVLEALGPSPHKRLVELDARALTDRLAGFKHRWTTTEETVGFLLGIGSVLERFGGLEACFLEHHSTDADSTLQGLAGFARELRGGDAPSSLLSSPEKGSACKRLHLYLRWMVRSDSVDPGCWNGVSPSQLIVPLDTHMHRVARSLNATRRKQANLAAAIDLTRAFRELVPDDPVRFDFALTRLGIRQELDLDDFLLACGQLAAKPGRTKG